MGCNASKQKNPNEYIPILKKCRIVPRGYGLPVDYLPPKRCFSCQLKDVFTSSCTEKNCSNYKDMKRLHQLLTSLFQGTCENFDISQEDMQIANDIFQVRVVCTNGYIGYWEVSFFFQDVETK